MNKNEAFLLVQQTFTKAFSEEHFVGFVRNLLPGIEAASTRTVSNAQLPQGFREHVHSYTRLGTYRDPQGDVLDVVIVKLKKRGSLDRARTRQRNLMAHYLNKRGKDAVLVAYITYDPSDWRFSYVKLTYQTEITDEGKVKAKSKFTPARRYSFLVGENEPNHTAQKQLGDLLMQSGRLTLQQIEEAFNIESVTKEFFEDYRYLFLKVKENLDQIVLANQQVKAEFERCEIDTINFSKKSLGQIVFLYFIQKKGWLGVAKDGAWGTGDKKFLHNLYLNKGDQNYFDDILEPFFYDALAIERKGDYYPALKCKVPFLNGGLFEPLNGYDWENTQINLDNQIFEEVFRIFNLYNFTVREDEPLEKEVAVDPEMLGKVFENLLEIKDRKSKAAYYTPREIVHYMCQESLITYLDTILNTETQTVAIEDIESFIRKGDASLENDLAKDAGRKSGDYGLPESIRKHAKKIDFALADVKICDPAIGSGAFPVGMMTEIVRTRNVLTLYLPNQRNRDAYKFKWHCIENSLYGVDIDASAVEIAKLRLWLSLVVDEKSYDHIRPLPNLDYRIVCGNSLLSIQKDLFNYTLYPELEKKKFQYFGTTSSRNKDTLRKEIDDLMDQLTDSKEIFDFEVYFSEVFSSKQGFDVVLGNPPYGIVYDDFYKKAYKKQYPSFKRNNDIYVAFYEKGVDLLGKQGFLTYISPNTFLNGDYFKTLRELLTRKTKIIGIRDYKEVQVFDDPTVFVCVFECARIQEAEEYQVPILVAASMNEFVSNSFSVTGVTDLPFKADDPIYSRITENPQVHFINDLFFVKDVGFNYWTKGRRKTRGGDSIGKRVFYKGDQKHQKDIPFIKGRDIHKWHIDPPSNYLKNNYKDLLNPDVDTFRYSQNFFEIVPKIIYRQTANTIIATIDDHQYFVDKTVHIVTPKHNWEKIKPTLLLGLLNSKLYAYLYRYLSQETHGRAFAQVKTTYIKKLPIIHDIQSKKIDAIVTQLLEYKAADKKSDTSKLEAIIDQSVYDLFELTEEERAIVEESVGR